MTKLSKDANKTTLYFGASIKVSHKDYAEGNESNVTVYPKGMVGLMTWDTLKSSEKIRMEYCRFDTTRAFADLDLKLDGCSLEDYNKCHNQLFDCLKKNASLHDFVYTNGSYYASGGGKVSAHIIFPNRYIRKSTFRLDSESGKKMISKILHGVEDYEYYANGFDKGVYQNKHCFRLPYAKMSGKQNVHVPMPNTSVDQYFITLLPDDDVYVMNEDDVVEEEPKQKSEKTKKKEELEKLLETPLEAERLLALVDCLDPAKRANCAYSDWFKLACVLHNTLPYGLGLQKFTEISMASGYEKADEKECERVFSSLSYDHNRPLGERTLIRWAKEDNPFKAKLALKGEDRFSYDFVFTVNNHKQNLFEFVESLNSPLPQIVRDRHTKTIYIRESNLWTPFNKKAKPFAAYFNRLPITIAQAQKGELIRVDQNLQWMDQFIWRFIETEIPEMDILDKFISTTKFKVCFPNGVFDGEKQTFTPWDKNTHVYTNVMAPHPYEPAMEEEIQAALTMLETDYHGPQAQNVVRRLSQMIFGFIAKLMGLAISGRDAGKSALMKLLEGCFGSYVQSFKAEHLLVHEHEFGGRDPELLLNWMLPLLSARIAYSNETDPKNKFLNSALIKLLQGGDKLNARALYQQATLAFDHSISFILCMNKQPPATSDDIMPYMFSFSFPYSYYSQEKKKEMGDSWNDALCKERIVDYTKELLVKHRRGLTDLLLRSFSKETCEILPLNAQGDIQDDEKKEMAIDQKFNACIGGHFKKDPRGSITQEQIKAFYEKHVELSIRPSKELIAKIQVLGAVYNKNVKNDQGKYVRGYKGISFIEKCCFCKEEDDNCPKGI